MVCANGRIRVELGYEQMIVSGVCELLMQFAGVSEEESEGNVVEWTKEGKVGRSFIGFTSALARHE